MIFEDSFNIFSHYWSFIFNCLDPGSWDLRPCLEIFRFKPLREAGNTFFAKSPGGLKYPQICPIENGKFP